MRARAAPAALLAAFLAVQAAHAQEYYDTEPMLGVEVVADSQYLYEEGGAAVVVGEVRNNDPLLFLGSVGLQVRFYGGTDPAPLAVAGAETVLGAIPPGSTSPFVARAPEGVAGVTDAEVGLAGGFDVAGAKADALEIAGAGVVHGGELVVRGEVRNSVPERGVAAHAVLYDGFDPPRVLRVASAELGDMLPNSRAPFEFRWEADHRAASVAVLAESDSSYAGGRASLDVPPREALRTAARIAGVSLEHGGGPGEVPVGAEVGIRAAIEPLSGDGARYVYYAQVKGSGAAPHVEFLGSAGGALGDGSSPSVTWVPEREGLYFVETVLWDASGVPIAERGPFQLVLVR